MPERISSCSRPYCIEISFQIGEYIYRGTVFGCTYPFPYAANHPPIKSTIKYIDILSDSKGVIQVRYNRRYTMLHYVCISYRAFAPQSPDNRARRNILLFIGTFLFIGFWRYLNSLRRYQPARRTTYIHPMRCAIESIAPVHEKTFVDFEGMIT